MRSQLAIRGVCYGAAVVALLAHAAVAAVVPFATRADVEAGVPVLNPIPADMDRDGDLDVVAYQLGGTPQVVWYENTAGNASVWSTPHPVAPVLAKRILVADVDGEGDLDVVVTRDNGADLVWYENEGAGASFAGAVAIVGSSGIGAPIAAADFDRDGDLDIVYLSNFETVISWAENLGDGSSWTFGHSVAPAGSSAYQYPVLADLDGDGDVDVAASQSVNDDRVVWFENTGGGSFALLEPIGTGLDDIVALRAADLDRDGDLDLATAASGDSELTWFENTAGDASSWSPHLIAPASPAPTDLAVSDLDQDGDFDLLLAVGTTTRTFENSLGDASQWNNTGNTAASGSDEIAVGDLDADGDPDVVSASSASSVIGWSANRTIRRSARHPVPSDAPTGTTDPRALAAGDFDVDGDEDLAVGSFGSGVVRWHANSGIGSSFGAGQSIDAAAPASEYLGAVDLDRDGDLDLLASSKGDERLVWHENRLRQSLAWSEHLIDGAIADPDEAIALDVDGDGDLDVLAGTATSSGPLTLYRNAGLVFSAENLDTGAESRGLVAADFDADGDLDLAVANQTTGTDRIDWYQNTNGVGSAWTRLSIRQGTNMSPASLDAADVDGDGDLDLVACSSGANDVTWHANDGTPGGPGDWWMTEVASVSLGGAVVNCQRVRALDFDADGDVDIAAWGSSPGSTWFYENSAGDGSAWMARQTTPGGGIEAAVSDLDRDGRLDLLGLRAGPAHVRWFSDLGGQFALTTAPIGYQGMVDGRQRQVLYISYLHRGRATDSDAELAALELRVTNGAGTNLSAAQANALFDKIAVRRDSATGTVIATASAPFTLSAGVLTLAFADADPNVQLAATLARPLYVMATLNASASTASPNQFQIVHVTEASSSAEDASTDLPLSLEFEADTSSGVIQALSPTGDADADGLANAAEADTQLTDPLDADTDSDELSDGAEVNTHGSNPLLKDTDGDGLLDGPEVTLGTIPIDPDSDDDLICDGPTQVALLCTLPGTDNCPLISNAAQTNSDALPSGDLCQCGDLSGDGPVTATDYARARELVVGRTPSGPADADRCDVTGDSACTVEDLSVLERFLASATVTVQTRCDAWFGP